MRIALLISAVVLILLTGNSSGKDEEYFCKHGQFNDAMFYKGKLLIFKGDDFWEMDGSRVPLPTPKKADAKKIKDHFKGMETNVTSVSELGGNKIDAFVWVKDQKIHFMKNKDTEEKVMSVHEFLYGPGSKIVNKGIKNKTTLWYNRKSRRLFVFTGYKYNEMEKKAGKWQVSGNQDRKVVRDFKINVFIDSAVTIGDSGILMSKDWFFTIPLVQFLWPGTAYGGQLSLGWDKNNNESLGLFNTYKDCGMYDNSFYEMAFDKDLNHGLEDPDEVGVDATYEGKPGQPPDVTPIDEPEVEGDNEDGIGGGSGGSGSGDSGSGGSGSGSGSGGTGPEKKNDTRSSSGGNLLWYILVPIVIVILVIVAVIVGVIMFKKKSRSASPAGSRSHPPSRSSSRRSQGTTSASPTPQNPHTPLNRSPSRGSGRRPKSAPPGEAIEMTPMNLPDVVKSG